MRIDKINYYLLIAKQVAQRSTCFRRRFGAIIVREDAIIATGYVGAPRKTRDCFERGSCFREANNIPHGSNYELCRSVHAEQNAIINAARSGSRITDSDMYLYGEDLDGNIKQTFPCFICKKMIINSGIKRVICSSENGPIIYEVEDWVKEWQEGDLFDTDTQYGK
jgi:dCMP deaminase